MNIRISGTGERHMLVLWDEYWNDWAADYIQVGTNPDFTYDEDFDDYLCSRETFEWWQNMLADRQKMETRIGMLRYQYRDQPEALALLEAALDSVHETDLKDEIDATHAALDEVFGSRHVLTIAPQHTTKEGHEQ